MSSQSVLLFFILAAMSCTTSSAQASDGDYTVDATTFDCHSDTGSSEGNVVTTPGEVPVEECANQCLNNPSCLAFTVLQRKEGKKKLKKKSGCVLKANFKLEEEAGKTTCVVRRGVGIYSSFDCHSDRGSSEGNVLATLGSVRSERICATECKNDPDCAAYTVRQTGGCVLKTKYTLEEDAGKKTCVWRAVAPCVPYSIEACKDAARALGLRLGSDKVGHYEGTKGCYAYDGGSDNGQVYYSMGGTEDQMKAAPNYMHPNQFRPNNYDCDYSAAPIACRPYSEAACREAVRILGLELGIDGHPFVGVYQTKGCWAYNGGKWNGHAFYSTGGSVRQMQVPVRGRYKFRPNLHDCYDGDKEL